MVPRTIPDKSVVSVRFENGNVRNYVLRVTGGFRLSFDEYVCSTYGTSVSICHRFNSFPALLSIHAPFSGVFESLVSGMFFPKVIVSNQTQPVRKYLETRKNTLLPDSDIC